MAGSRQAPFSARNRGRHRQLDADFPESARTGLLHLLFDLESKDYVTGWPAVANELQRIGRLLPAEYESRSIPSARKAKADAETALAALRWDKVYDFCERLHSHLAVEIGYYVDNDEYTVKTARSVVQASIAEELDRLFSEEDLAFEFSDGVVRRRGRKHTVDVSTRAQVVLGDP